MATFPTSAEIQETLARGVTATTRAGGQIRGAGNDAGGAAGGNPYSLMYQERYGYIFGKPMSYHPRTDPNQRVFQKTILRNNTIMNIIPGVPWQDDAMMTTAREIIDGHYKWLQDFMANNPPSKDRTKRIMQASTDTQDKLVKAGVDLRYAVFKQDIAGFMEAFQMTLNRVGTAIFGTDGGLSRFITDMAGVNIKEDTDARGFKVWVEKGTSISESIDNSYTRSVLEDVVKNVSGVVKQAKFLGQGVGLTTTENATGASSELSEEAQTVGTAANIASRTLSGAMFSFPQVFDDSKFNRSYEISFRFVSPYGYDRSVYYHVLLPFLFLLNCALPRQDGPSGHTSPFILQVDAPGYFSCPMGVVTSFSFRKGGDEALFNTRGLPLVIEGSMSITDLYSNLSLPLTYSQFATNLGTSAFLNTLGGLSLYASLDSSLINRFTNRVKDGLTSIISPFNIVSEETLKLQRFFGIK